MTNFVSNIKFRRSLWIGLMCVLVLSACSGNSPAQELQLSGAAAAALDGGAAQGSSYAPAAIPPAEAAAPVALAAKAGSGALPTASQPGQVGLPPADGQGAAAVELPMQAKAPAPAVDPSLPVEARVGARAPEISLQTLDGRTVSLSELLGHPVVVSYWTSWCIPCKQELPILERLSQEFASQGLIVLTVNALDQDELAKVQAMAQELGMTFPVLLDAESAFASAYNAMFFPSTYYIGPDGVIREIKLGDSTEADMRAKVQNLLAGQ